MYSPERRKEKRMNKKSRNMVRTIILIATVLALAMSATVGIIGFNHIKKAYFASFKEGLKTAALLIEDELAHEWTGDFALNDKNELLKGGVSIHDTFQSQLDALNKNTGMHFTIFFGDTRYITSLVDSETGKRMENTKASDVVIAEVLNKGNEYLAENFSLAGQNWYAYYLPLKNSDGSVVGMIFAGRDTSIVDKNLKSAALAILFSFIGFFLFNFAVARVLISTTSRAMRDIVESLGKLEDGELDFYIHGRTFNRKDELGLIAASSAQVRDKLQDVISATKKLSDDVTKSGENLASSAATASSVAEQVTIAVEDISRGAASQAESVENSVTNTNEMGNSIDEITDRIEALTGAADEMLEGANRTVDTLKNLIESNENIMESMKDIDSQIRLTNDSVKEIADATGMITDIANQTHLLSLNASIEAARAGEAGRGFAVVAEEIGNLSAQSKDAANSIIKIVETLVSESAKSVETIGELSKSMTKQNDRISSTKDDMDSVVENVNNVDSSTRMISEKIHLLNSLKASFSDIISELAAISQQNAAATEETNASMEELNATFALISQAASDLREMAETLNDKMAFFTLSNLEKEEEKTA